MSRHILSLEIPTVYNEKILRINDETVYLDTPVKNARLTITVPGFNVPVELPVEKHFSSVITACDLQIQNSRCGDDQWGIPDGIYIVRYALPPHSKLFVEYNHLRATSLLNKYYHKLAAIRLATCSPVKETEEQLKELRLVKSYIDAAKAKVECMHRPGEGLDLLMYAGRRLNGLCKN